MAKQYVLTEGVLFKRRVVSVTLKYIRYESGGSSVKKQTEGIVISVAKQWWFKVNTKSFRSGPLDGAIFPHIIKVQYWVDGEEHFCRKWIGAGIRVPQIGEKIKVTYLQDKPKKTQIEY